MTLATYQVELYDPLGIKRLGVLTNFISLEYARKVNDIGTLLMSINALYVPPAALDQNQRIMRDLRIAVYRSVDGAPLALDTQTVWFVRGSRRRLTKNGAVYDIRAVDANHLLKRRIIAYAAGTAQAKQTAAADDMLKQIVRQNLGAAATAARQMIGVAVDVDMALATSVSKGFAWQNMLQTLQEICNDAAQATPPIFLAFDVVATSVSTLAFKTFINQRGIDRRKTTPIGSNNGNLANASTDYDTLDEITHAYAGGQGEKTLRAVVEYNDTARSGLSPYNRIETWVDVRNDEDAAGLPAEARAAVRAGRPVFSFEGDLVSVPNSVYGVDFTFGDRVRASDDVDSFDCRIDAIQVTVTSSGDAVAAKLWSAD